MDRADEERADIPASTAADGTAGILWIMRGWRRWSCAEVKKLNLETYEQLQASPEMSAGRAGRSRETTSIEQHMRCSS